MWKNIKAVAVFIGLTVAGLLYAKAKSDAREAKLTIKYNAAEAKLTKNSAKRKRLEDESSELRKEYTNARSAYRLNLRNRKPRG